MFLKSRPEKWHFDKFAYQTLNSFYEEYIEFGGFPAVAMSESNERKKQLLDIIYSSYINQDVKMLADFKSVTELKKLIRLLGARVGSRLNIDGVLKTKTSRIIFGAAGFDNLALTLRFLKAETLTRIWIPPFKLSSECAIARSKDANVRSPCIEGNIEISIFTPQCASFST